MTRFTTKDMLRGMTLAAVGFGMLAIVLNDTFQATSKELKLLQAFLITFGGTFIGYGFAFPFKWPPHRMMLAMTGMFAASSWFDGNFAGLIVIAMFLVPYVMYQIVKMLRSGQRS